MISNSGNFVSVFEACFMKHGCNFDDACKTG